MNKKQAIRASNMKALEIQIENLEYVNTMQAVDIQDYVAAMHAVIGGESPCEWCEEKRLGDCTNWETTSGCNEWWLRLRPGHPLAQQMEKQKEENANDCETVLPAGPAGGE